MTPDLVDELVTRYNGWNRDGQHGVLRYINTANSILMSVDSQRNLMLDSATGVIPVLATTAGVFQYTMPATVRRVSGVLIPLDSGSLPQLQDYGNYNVQYLRRPLRTTMPNARSIGGRFYTVFPYVRTRDYKNSSTLAMVMFTIDPGTTTDQYFRESYQRPTEILSESIPVDVPEPYDMEILLPAAAKLIEGVQSGNYIEAYQLVEREFKKTLWERLNEGDQGEYDAEPVDRGF